MILLRFLSALFWKEFSQCYSMQSIASVRMEMQRVFEKTKGWSFTPNLAGEFISENEFKASPKWQLSNTGTMNSYLRGKICVNEHGKTVVKFSVRPNSSFLISPFFFLIFGIFALTSVQKNDDQVIVGVIFTFFAPAILVLIGFVAKRRLKNRFIKLFNLRSLH